MKWLDPLLAWLMGVPYEDRRPKRPRPAVAVRPQVPRPKPQEIKKEERAHHTAYPGKPPRGGSGALPAPPPDCPRCKLDLLMKTEFEDGSYGMICKRCLCTFTDEDFPKTRSCPFVSGRDDITEPSTPDCPHCEVGRVKEIQKPGAFMLGCYHCMGCDKYFTEEDVAKAKNAADVDAFVSTECEGEKTFVPRPPKKPSSKDRVRPTIEGGEDLKIPGDPLQPITLNVAGFIGSEAELAAQLREIINHSGVGTDEHLEEDQGDAARAYREERNRRGGVPMYPEDGDAEEKKDQNQIPTAKGWRKPEPKPAPETSSVWWTAIKWIIGVGASIGLGWIAEWAFF